jgi:hypothetical protein
VRGKTVAAAVARSAARNLPRRVSLPAQLGRKPLMSIIAPWGYAPFRALAIMLAVASGSASAHAAENPKGIVVLAHSAPTALLIWDASPVVGDLVIARRLGDAGIQALEIDAIHILAARAPGLHAKRVEVRVQYAPTGVVGAAYQASTFANETPILSLAADRALVAAEHQAWIAAVASQRRPQGLTVTMLGAFPSPQ